MSGEGLAGRRIVVTRSEAQARVLCRRLEELGAEPVPFPVIRFEPIEPPELPEIVAELGRLDWLVLTSVNAVERFFALLEQTRPGAVADLASGSAAVAVVGDATARALEQHGIAPRAVPEEFRGEALVECLGELTGRRVLLPRSRIGRPEIARALRERGALVREIAIYDTVRAQPGPEALAELRRGIDAVTFTSPSSVRSFLAILEDAGLDRGIVADSAIACIGPVTAQEARSLGLSPEVVPEDYTVPGLVAALEAWFARTPEHADPVRGRTAGGSRS
ncbi:MAG TPA: uroporphyrinogen-III synthase [Thermoanaerobaculia bacterium]|nr:uroporphyrinogen-III synthase [Thermoanaerobaculia bacterium]